MKETNPNTRSLEQELLWMERVIRVRLNEAFANAHEGNGTPPASGFAAVRDVTPPESGDSASAYSRFVAEQGLPFGERMLLILGLANHLRPDLLTALFRKGVCRDADFPEFGGGKGAYFQGFIPTGLTYLFIMGGYDLGDRLNAQGIFMRRHLFAREGILSLEPHFQGEPSLSGKLAVSENWVERFTAGSEQPDPRSIKYASLRSTPLNDEPGLTS